MAVERTYLPASRFPGLEAVDLAGRSLYEALASGWGVPVAVADQWVGVARLTPDDARTLHVAPAVPALLFQRVTREGSGAIIEYVRALYRGDRYELHTALEPEALEGGDEALAPGRELGHAVEQDVDGDRRAHRHGGLVDPLAGQRRDRPRAEQHPPAAVGHQPQLAVRLALVGPGPRQRRGQVDGGRGHVVALLARLRLGQPDGGQLRVGEHHPRHALVARPARAAEQVGGHHPPLVLGDVGEQRHPGHVADRPDPLGDPAAAVDRHAAPAGLDADGLKPQARRARRAAR